MFEVVDHSEANITVVHKAAENFHKAWNIGYEQYICHSKSSRQGYGIVRHEDTVINRIIKSVLQYDQIMRYLHSIT